MFIIQNALKSITRNTLRNILIGIIVLVIAVSSCVALSIREAAETTKEETLANMSVTAQISFDRTKAMEEMSEQMNNGEQPEKPQGGFDRGKFDFEQLGSSLTLDDYMTYTEALSADDSYYYSSAISLNASGDILPYGTEESDEETDSTAETTPEMPQNGQPGMMGGNMQQGGGRGMMMQNQGDFAITGYSSYDGMLSLFGDDGTCSISEGEMFTEDSSDLSCVISDEFAMYNDLEVGDKFTLCNPQYEEETYTLSISGIYTNSNSSSEEMSRFAMNDPANNIYMSYNSVKEIIDASEKAGNTVTDDSTEEETSAVITSSLSFTYSFDTVENYNSFADEVYDLGLSEDYTVTSSDISAFENSLTPLETLSTTAMWFFIIVLIVGGIILITLNIFNLRERKYEVGVLTAIGMKKSKVALQFLTEIFIVTFIAIIVGTGIGASVSVPVTNSLLESQITSSQESSSNLNERFGFGGQNSPDGRNIPEAPNGNNTQNKGSNSSAMMGGRFDRMTSSVDYVDSVSSATNLFVILELVAVGLFLTVISSLAALISIMRYEPLKILSSRS